VLFCGRLFFGFTGRGDLGRSRRTDLWLAERIAEIVSGSHGGDQGTLLRGVATTATELFAKAYRGQRHAFIAVGWARFGARATNEPGEAAEFSRISPPSPTSRSAWP
jgi:hypothetical protein